MVAVCAHDFLAKGCAPDVVECTKQLQKYISAFISYCTDGGYN